MPDIDEGRSADPSVRKTGGQGLAAFRLLAIVLSVLAMTVAWLFLLNWANFASPPQQVAHAQEHVAGVTSPLAPPVRELTNDVTGVITAQQLFTAYLPLLYKPMVLYLPLLEVTSGFVTETPADGAQNQSPNTFLAWHWDHPDAGQARYTLFLEENDPNPDAIVAQNLVRTLFAPAPLALNSTYYWQVETLDAQGRLVRGPVWSFRTEGTVAAPQVGVMVPVPAGEFLMGCDLANRGRYQCEAREFPLHRVWLDAYEIDKYEVTNGEYRACVSAGVCQRPLKFSSNQHANYYANSAFRDYPVLYVSWWNAQEYCGWAGKRLPTEAEWEKAARGPVDTRIFPWGNQFTPDCTHANRAADLSYGAICNEDTTRVGSFPLGSSPYGALDMSGNVFEWVTDYFNQTYYQRSPYRNPVNTVLWPELLFVIRGGSYRDNIQYLRTSHRHFGHWGPTKPNEDVPYYRSSRVGFRCAHSLPTP